MFFNPEVVTYHPLIYLYAFVIGACCGSFLNVCIARLPLNLSLILPPSHCFCCGSRIKFFNNLPLLSYLWQRGSCRQCASLFSSRYFFVELLAGLVAVLLIYFQGISFLTFYYYYLFAVLLVASIIDLDLRIIPDQLTYSGMVLGLFLGFCSNYYFNWFWLSFSDSLLGLLLGGGVLFLVALCYRLVTAREGMGLGDVKLLAMLGALLGYQFVLPILLWSSLLGSIFGLVILILFAKDRRYPIPFGPFIALGTLLALVIDPWRILMLIY